MFGCPGSRSAQAGFVGRTAWYLIWIAGAEDGPGVTRTRVALSRRAFVLDVSAHDPERGVPLPAGAPARGRGRGQLICAGPEPMAAELAGERNLVCASDSGPGDRPPDNDQSRAALVRPGLSGGLDAPAFGLATRCVTLKRKGDGRGDGE